MSDQDCPGFDELIQQARSAGREGRFSDCMDLVDCALQAKPGDCYAASIRIGCQRRISEQQAQEACRWASERAESCQWSKYFRGEHAWSIYAGWLKLDGQDQVLGRAYTLAREAIHRILGMTKPHEDQFVRARSALRFLDLATKDSDWNAVVEVTDLATGDEFDRTRPERTQQLPNPESEYEKWARRRAEGLSQLGRHEEAIELASTADDAQPGNIWLARERGLCECAGGQYTTGAKRLERLYSSKPDFYIAGEVGDCYADAGDYERAAQWYSKAALRTSPPFAINFISKLAVVLERLGDLEGSVRNRRLVWATAFDRGWEAKATRSRSDLLQFVQRHPEAFSPAPEEIERPPRMHDAKQACGPVWDRWRTWRPPSALIGKVTRYSPALREGDISSGGRTYKFTRDDFESPEDPVYDQQVEFVAEEGPDGQLRARQVRPR
jgi:tetratricopeptide (TPR) repeat protein